MARSILQYSYDARGNPVIGTVNGVQLQILRQPVQQIVVPGDTATFSVVVSDTREVTFQWKFNGTDIPGETGDSVVLTNVSAANEGQYSVEVMDTAGSITSTSVELMLDNDNDGLPDNWEIAHFGNTTSQRSEGDPDGDGVSNLDEFLDDTNPTSDTSFRPRLTAYSDAGGSVAVAPMKLSYDPGETVTLTATPFAPGVFVDWIGDLNSTSNPAILTMDGNKKVQARFASAVPIPLPDVALGASYTQQLTTILRGPISFSLATGMLPPGMALSSAGVVSGVSGVPGIFDFTVRATNAAGDFTEQMYVLRVLQPVALPADLLAWWRAEPATGSVVPDIIGGHDGFFLRGNIPVAPAYTPDGKVESAFAFDGTLDLLVPEPDVVELRPNEMTVEAWVFPTVQTGDHQSVIGHGSSTNDNDAWWLGVFNGKPRFRSNHLGSRMTVLEAPSTIPLNQWTHLAASFDGMTRRLYVSGMQVASQSGLGTLVYDPALVAVTIGSDWAFNASRSRFNGRVDEVSLYRRALSSEEVFSLADAGAAGKSAVGPYITSPSRLPFAIVGQAYTQTFTFVQGTAPVMYGLSSDSSLPANLTLISAGVLSGVPTKTGSFIFGVRAIDAVGLFTEQPCVLQIFDNVTAPAGLVGWWRAEGNARDSAGTNHGTLRNGAAFAAGKVGQAFSLDGTNDCIEIPDAPALRPVSLTLEAWVAFDVVTGLRVIFAKPLGTGTSLSYALWLSSETLRGAISDAVSGGPELAAPFSPIPGHWYHVAYTFDDSTHQQALYVDGIQIAIGLVTKSISYDTRPLLLGRDTNSFLGGSIDEASIYDRALTDLEIASIYEAGPAGKRL